MATPTGGAQSPETYPSTTKPNALVTNIIDRPLSDGTGQVSLSAFSFLFAETVQYLQDRINHVAELERRLEDLGHDVGWRLLDVIVARSKPNQRETKVVNMLHFVHSTCWKSMFGRSADALERSTEREDEYHIHDKDPVTNTFISVPKDLGRLNCASFVAGIVRGLLTAGGFKCTVTAHLLNATGSTPQKPMYKTIYQVKFDETVMQREK